VLRPRQFLLVRSAPRWNWICYAGHRRIVVTDSCPRGQPVDATSTATPPAGCPGETQQAVRCVRASLLRTLSARFPATPMPDITAAIRAEDGLEILLRWYEAVAVALTLEQARNAICPPPAPKPPDSPFPWLEREFFENQEKVKPEDLVAYAGQYIAWSWDGARVVASDPDEAELRRKVAEASHDPHHVVYAYVDE
jgi:hypothetical protein